MPTKPVIKPVNAEYWKQRAISLEDSAARMGAMTDAKIQKLFRSTFKELDESIQAYYKKYGKIGDTPTFKTLPDGSKVISGTDKRLLVSGKDSYVRLGSGTRLSKLQSDLKNTLKNLAADQNNQMISGLSDVCEQAYLQSTFNLYQGLGVGKSFSLLPESTVRTLIANEVNGKNFSQRVWANNDKLADNVNMLLKNGIVQGLSNVEMTKRLAASMDSGYKVASTLIRTEVTNTLNQATLQSYHDSGVVSRYEYLATLDSRTSSVCRELDGEKFPLEEAATGLNYPPMHPRCRSTTIPWFDDSDQEITRVARDGTGNTVVVPSNMTYKDFKAVHVDKTKTMEEWAESNKPVEPMKESVEASYDWKKAIADRAKSSHTGFNPDNNYRVSEAKYNKIASELITIVEDTVDSSPISIAVPRSELRNILTDKRLKSTYETGKRNKEITNVYLENRTLIEKTSFGVPENIDPKDRIIYGFVDDGTKNKVISKYGDVKIVLKSDTKKRSSFTAADSLNNKNITPFKQGDKLNTGHIPQGSPYFSPSGEKAYKSTDYIEAQIHGGVSIDDFDYVIINKHVSKADIAFIEELGIPWRMDK